MLIKKALIFLGFLTDLVGKLNNSIDFKLKR
nr:MAG TPA: hypothetical protein [Caudoviricetes sp.]DAX15828.1 MAG TPA: hypothetical protein [Caudoviricetes sp.]